MRVFFLDDTLGFRAVKPGTVGRGTKMNVMVRSQIGTLTKQAAETPCLSVIIPVRSDPELPYILSRLEDHCRGFSHSDNVEFLVVDSGSDTIGKTKAEAICAQHGIRYLYHDSRGQVFSIGDARDFGAQYARGETVTFIDVDLRVPSDFWNRLLNFMEVFGISKRKKAFFVVPTLYLTQAGTSEFLSRDGDKKFAEMYLRWLYGDTDAIEAFAPCSSVIIVNRHHYLSVGGHRPEFRGHGFEDFELIHRLILEDGTLPRADNYYKDTRSWDTATYNGFRSQFSLLGRPAMMANLFVVHLWHPRPKTASFYNPGAMKLNRDIWVSLFQEFDRTSEHPDPLICSSAIRKNIMFFGEPKTNNSRCFRDVFPFLGNPKYISEYQYIDSDGKLLEDDLEATIQQLAISMIAFPNPYGNEARLAIYRWCRRKKFPYVAFDRGALPDSWFFDPKGFNADSSSYRRKLWDKPLSEDQRLTTVGYIEHCLYQSGALERQGDRIGPRALREKLKIGGKKVLFVPLQRPSDTVIRHFCGPAQSFENFLGTIDEAAERLARLGWTVLCKKHPLETSNPPLQYATYVPEDTHFLDLLELCDAVALINSGVGIYAMMMEKPCYIFGRSFYSFDGINVTLAKCSSEELCEHLMAGMKVDMEAVYRFIHYLITDFYSFGRASLVEAQEADGSRRTRTRAIDFYELQVPGRRRIRYEKWAPDPLPKTAPLFERYKLDLWQKKESQEKVSPSSKSSAAQKSASLSQTTSKTVTLSSKEMPKAKTADKPASPAAAPSATKNKTRAKLAKLIRDPEAFFKDSQKPLIKPLKYLF